jgi:drug/metabolite transporter (DMT)-like permease
VADDRSVTGGRVPVWTAFVALCFLWGSTYLFIKIGIDYWPPVLLAGTRNLLAFVAVALVLVAAATIWRRPRQLPGPRGWVPPAVFALLQGTAFALIFWAERYITSGQTAVLIATNPLFTLPLTRFWLKDRISGRQYLAVLLGLIGVALTAGVREGEGFTGTVGERVTAQGAVLVAAFCYAFSLLYSRKYMHGDRYANTAIHLGTSAVYLLLLSTVMDPDDADVDFALPGLLALLYLALLGSALAYWLLFYLIDNLDPLQVSYVTVVNPVVAVLLGIVVLSEPVTPLVWLGAAAVVLGIYLVNRPARQPVEEPAPSPAPAPAPPDR